MFKPKPLRKHMAGKACRSWKGFDFDVMERLHAQGFIDNPVGKTKSVWLAPEGLERGGKIAERLFCCNRARAG